MNANHLTDAQFAECLTAEFPEPGIQSHLAQCDACRAELGVFMASMDSFSEAAMDWSRAQPVISPRAKMVHTRPTMATPLRWAVAAALIAAVGVPVAVYHERETVDAGLVADLGAGRLATANLTEDSPAQIAQDNQLLQSVDQALAASDPSPMQEYGLATPQNIPRKGSR